MNREKLLKVWKEENETIFLWKHGISNYGNDYSICYNLLDFSIRGTFKDVSTIMGLFTSLFGGKKDSENEKEKNEAEQVHRKRSATAVAAEHRRCGLYAWPCLRFGSDGLLCRLLLFRNGIGYALPRPINNRFLCGLLEPKL